MKTLSQVRADLARVRAAIERIESSSVEQYGINGRSAKYQPLDKLYKREQDLELQEYYLLSANRGNSAVISFGPPPTT